MAQVTEILSATADTTAEVTTTINAAIAALPIDPKYTVNVGAPALIMDANKKYSMVVPVSYMAIATVA